MRDSKLRRPERHCHSPTFLCSTALSVFLSLSISLFLSLLSVSLPLSIHPSFPTKRPRDVSLSRAHTRVRLYPPPQPVRTRRLLRVHQTSAFTRPHLPPHTLSTLSLSLSLSPYSSVTRKILPLPTLSIFVPLCCCSFLYVQSLLGYRRIVL